MNNILGGVLVGLVGIGALMLLLALLFFAASGMEGAPLPRIAWIFFGIFLSCSFLAIITLLVGGLWPNKKNRSGN